MVLVALRRVWGRENGSRSKQYVGLCSARGLLALGYIEESVCSVWVELPESEHSEHDCSWRWIWLSFQFEGLLSKAAQQPAVDAVIWV
jgi:hypothetical protein